MPRYKFEDIAFNITEKRMPVPEDKELYIGLEHLDTGCLWVTRWGSPVDIKGQKLVMHKGDLLFGRRNTYLRRAAIAPHDGLFSAHGMIFRPKTDVITAEFFPYFISSNYFMEAAIRISVGSLSPTVNWKQLKELEFDIPEIEDQSKYAELFSAIDRSREAYKTLITKTDELVKSQFIELFGDPIAIELADDLPELGAVCVLKAGKFIKADDIKEQPFDNCYPCYGGNGIRGYVSYPNQSGEHPLIGRQGALCGNVQFAVGDFYATEHAVVVTPNTGEQIDCFWLFHLLQQLKLERYATGAAQPGIAVNKLEKIHVCIPEFGKQNAFSNFAKQSDKSKFEAKQAIQTLDSLYLNIEKKCFS